MPTRSAKGDGDVKGSPPVFMTFGTMQIIVFCRPVATFSTTTRENSKKKLPFGKVVQDDAGFDGDDVDVDADVDV